MHIIRRIRHEEQNQYIDYSEALLSQSGKNGQPYFSPFEQSPDFRSESKMAAQAASWSKGVGDPGWVAVWIAMQCGKIIADVSLKNSGLPTQMHRAMVGIGVDRNYQRQGLATQLLDCITDFARSMEVRYLDLRVFAHNARAIALYQRCGFLETGRIVDCFRIHQESVDDIFMTLDLGVPSTAKTG